MRSYFHPRARNEARITLALSRGDAPEELADLKEVNWRAVLELAARHSVDPLIGFQLTDGAEIPTRVREAVPEEVIAHFHRVYGHHRMRNRALVTDLAALERALRRQGVEAIYFKGPWMSQRAYPDPGARVVGDIDLGIRERDYRGALKALDEIGYTPRSTPPASAAEALHHAHHASQLRFSAPGRRPVELHFRLANFGPPGPAEPWLWQGARRLDVGGESILVPGGPAGLLHLLLHANQHAYASLRLLFDIRFFLESEGALLSWDEVENIATALGCQPSIYFGLYLARDLAGGPLPSGAADRFRPAWPKRLLFSVFWRLPAVRRLDARPLPESWEAPAFYLLELGTMAEKARFLAGILREASWPKRTLHSGTRAQRVTATPAAAPSRRPALRDDLAITSMAGTFLVYDPFADVTAFLNPSAFEILRLCDGSREVRAIAAAYSQEMEIGEEDAFRDVSLALSSFIEQNLLREGGQSGVSD